MPKTFYLTTTLPYVNAPLHLGHALELIRADTVARYKKRIGFDVYFNTGTDEHGLKIYNKAEEQKISPQDFVDQGFGVFQEQLKLFGLSSEIHFIRTTDPHHEKAVQTFWRQVSANGYIYKKKYKAKYCVGCESEKTDSELVAGECPFHPGQALQVIEEENYFFRFSALADKLLALYEERPDFVVPHFRLKEIKNFVASGLQDFSISRMRTKLPWGISVPDDEEQVIYVWFDALVNYISTLAWPISSPAGQGESLFEKYWIAGTPTQYCGKDNLRFQSAMWPAMLLAAGLPVPHQIVVNGFITGEGGLRMSKTLGNVVDPRDLVREYGQDALRYFLLREVSNFEDSPFTEERFREAYNAGLANGLGNLTSRILTLAEKYLTTCPEISDLVDPREYTKFYEDFDLKGALDYVWTKIQILDEQIQTEEPFKVIKIDELKGREMIVGLVQKLYQIACLLESALPETSSKLKNLIRENKKPEVPLFLRKD